MDKCGARSHGKRMSTVKCPEHAKIKALKEKNKAAFQLKASLMWAQVAHPNDTLLNNSEVLDAEGEDDGVS